tara:strand:+ start:444 stop:650 length:207 start_codon:yes stop_codon:yes gene_type:complete
MGASDMNEAERLVRGMQWLGQQLAQPTLTEKRIAKCEEARDAAHDPDLKIIWHGKAQQLRNKRLKEAN